MEMCFVQNCYGYNPSAPLRNNHFGEGLEETILCDDSYFLRECRYGLHLDTIFLGKHITDKRRFSIAPHVGHFYTMVIADILKRWQVLLGNKNAQLLTGTDEHGMKVLPHIKPRCVSHD